MDSSRQSSPHSFLQTASSLSRLASWPGGLLADVRQALRQMRKGKWLALAMLATLALCIGTTTAIFSMVYSLILKPLPFPEAERLVEIYDSAAKAGLNKMPSNVVQYLDYSKNGKSYEALGLWTLFEGMLGEEGAVVPVSGVRATADLFEVLGVKPVIGRFFTKENCREGADKVVVITQSNWEAQYHEDPAVLGRTLRVDGESLTIIGVAPRVLECVDARMRLIRPLTWPAQAEGPFMRYALGLELFGRLKPGVTVAQAAAEAEALERRYYEGTVPQMRQFMDRSGIKEVVASLQVERVQPVKATLYLLQGVVVFVLLIGCVNVANLLLVRSNARQAELSIRFALGASRGTLVQQLLVESLVLTGCGALLGMGLAWGGLHVINRYTAQMLPQALPMALDGHVLVFGTALTVFVGLFIGLIPVVHLLRANLVELIQRSSRATSAGRGVRTVSSLLVIVQVAVALVLLTGAGLLIHSFARAVEVDPGLDPRGVVVGRIALPGAERSSDEAAKGFQERLIRALEGIPGVTSAAISFSTPFRGGMGINAMTLADDPLPPGSPQPGAWRVVVSPGYLATLRLRLVEGRFLEAGDQPFAGRRFVVDETFVRKFFPKRSAIGGRLSFSGRPEKDADWATIVGVVRDVPQNGVEDKSGNPFVYELPQDRPGGLTLFVRSERALGDIVPLIREVLHGIDPAIPLYDTTTLQKEVAGSFDSRRAIMLLLVAFAALALFLSALGIYGVLAYDVSQRTREIGIRGAIGATRWQVIAMILRQGLWKAGVGLVLGLVGAGVLSRSMTSLLFEVTPTDPMVYAGVSLVLLVVAVLASYLPARRAARIDPLDALRTE